MSSNQPYDAVIVGSGPNGLSAAVRLAMEGLKVKVFEAEATIGGGTRTLTFPGSGIRYDVCSAIHPMAAASPFFRSLPLEQYGLKWIHPEAPLAHPLDHEPAVLLHREIERMNEELGTDSEAWNRLFTPLSAQWEDLVVDLLSPLGIPSRPIGMARFGLRALRSASRLSRKLFEKERSRALFAGLAAHSMLPLEQRVSAAVGIVLGAAAHKAGWPMPEGGSQAIADALAGYLTDLGGEIETSCKINSLENLPASRTVLFNLSPKQILSIAGERLPPSYQKRLSKYRYGPGVFKVDAILSEPVPWQDPRCKKAGTVHLGGTLEEIAESERQMSRNRHSDHPYVLVAQQSLFDPARTSGGRHVLWAYCHVPSGSSKDMTRQIEDQIERFAPGYRDVVEERIVRTADDFESYNPNYAGGDINGGIQDLRQLFSRPASPFNPYAIPAKGLYICSSSTPPGGGVHGMCGYHCARLVLKREFGIKTSRTPSVREAP